MNKTTLIETRTGYNELGEEKEKLVVGQQSVAAVLKLEETKLWVAEYKHLCSVLVLFPAQEGTRPRITKVLLERLFVSQNVTNSTGMLPSNTKYRFMK